MDDNTIRRKLRAGNFVENNGRVLRIINILRHKYNKLSGIHYVLSDLQEDEVLDSINFLFEEGYIHLRETDTKKDANLADSDYRRLEAKLTGKGIRLLSGEIDDSSVAV